VSPPPDSLTDVGVGGAMPAHVAAGGSGDDELGAADGVPGDLTGGASARLLHDLAPGGHVEEEAA
jgi:hypothetical protein